MPGKRECIGRPVGGGEVAGRGREIEDKRLVKRVDSQSTL